jgi:hypothetical protein
MRQVQKAQDYFGGQHMPPSMSRRGLDGSTSLGDEESALKAPEERVDDSDLLSKRGLKIPVKYQPYVHTALGLAGAGVTLTMLASVADAPTQKFMNVIAPQDPRPQFKRRSFALSKEEAERTSRVELEREIASRIIEDAIRLEYSNATKPMTKDGTLDVATLERGEDTESGAIHPRGVSLAGLMPKILDYASKGVLVSMFTSLSDPLAQGAFNVFAPKHPTSGVQGSTAPLHRVQKRDTAQEGGQATMTESPLVKRKAFNLAQTFNNITKNKIVKSAFGVVKTIVF